METIDRRIRSNELDHNEELRVSMDGESHGVAVVVAVCSGILFATAILIFIMTLIKRSQKRFLDSRAILPKISSTPVPTISSTISARISLSSTSQQSLCMGIQKTNGRVQCCKEIVPLETIITQL